MIVRDTVSSDASSIADIYNHYIHTSHATFELEPIDAAEMERRITDTVDQRYPFLIVENEGSVLGYAYGRPFRPRPGYRHAVEVAVYVKHDAQGRGIGGTLYDRLISLLFERGAHSLIAAIALPNESSVRLHERFGFKKAGHFLEVGRKFDRWIDIGYWQLLRQND
jgi:phosphinothricin acetyltransferase